MRLLKFRSTMLNGFLDLDIDFHDDLTFVTGINGTGKTSALNSIAALLFPRLDHLASATYERIQVDLIDEGNRVSLSSTSFSDGAMLQCSEFPDDVLHIPTYEPVETVPTYRREEHEAEFYKDFLATHKNHAVIRLIEKLPSPMFLGLDRRSISFDREKYRYSPRRRSQSTLKRNVFGRSLGASLDEALYFARDHYQEKLRSEARLDAQFRERLVLALIDFQPISFFSGQLEDPTNEELNQLQTAKQNLSKLPSLLNASSDEISSRVDPIFNFLDSRIKTPRKRKHRNKPIKDSSDERINALIEWSFNKTQIAKINLLSSIVSSYNDETQSLFQYSSRFLDTINSFLRDSGKFISFDSFGDLIFHLDGDPSERDIRTLSSGEIQIIVILTHLFFNPEVSSANVFIIDEPELSLHVQWQEKFVDAVMIASENTQFIMATHSPTIILHRVSQCVDLSRHR